MLAEIDGEKCWVDSSGTYHKISTYPRTRRSWLSDAQAFIDCLIVLLLASVFLNVYLAFRVLEASK